MQKHIFFLFLLAIITVLTACGGGGSDGNKTTVKINQDPLQFSIPEITLYPDGSVPLNALVGGSGSGAITYQSSRPGIAQVDTQSGVVVILSAGDAVITATKQSDVTYNAISASYQLKIIKYDQDLVFEQSSISAVLNGPDVNNPLLDNSGSGQVSYSSSDEKILLVNSVTGHVNPIAAGTVIITAVKAEDDRYYSATASYTIEVVELLGQLEINVGMQDTEIRWQAQKGMVSVHRTTDSNCDYSNISLCSDYDIFHIEDVNAALIIDQFTHLTQDAYLIFETNGYRSKPVHIKAASVEISRRFGVAFFEFDSKLWTMGGAYSPYDPGAEEYSTTFYNDIWSSIDGINWVLEKEDAGINVHIGHRILELNGTLYLLGGLSSDGHLMGSSTQIWKSTDAKNWELINENVVYCQYPIVFKEKLWCYQFNRLFSSSDGVVWTEELVDWISRREPMLYVFNERLFLAAGCHECWENNHELKNDIWSTSNGVDWQKDIDEAIFPPLENARVAEFNGTLIMTGGTLDYAHHNKSLSSDDGVNWRYLGEEIIDDMSWQHELIPFNERLFIYSDVAIHSETEMISGLLKGFIWTSRDGVSWRVPMGGKLEWVSLD